MRQAYKPVQSRLDLKLEPTHHSPKSMGTAIDLEFPVEQANLLAERESFNKHLFRPNTYLHKWWARRSGTTFRHILKQLCDDPAARDYYVPGGLENKIILDPMMGGGTTLHEAIRLGASVIGFDIDPIPVLQATASLTALPLASKQVIFEQFYASLAQRLRPLNTTTCPICDAECETQFTLYCLRKRCACGEALLVDSFLLREEPNGANIELCANGRDLTITGQPFEAHWTAPSPVYEKDVRECPVCHETFQDMKAEPFTDRYVPLVVVGACSQHGLFYKFPDPHDLQLIQKARDELRKNALPSLDALRVAGGPKSDDLLNKGISSFRELFTPRQLIYISTCKTLLDAVDAAHRPWLGMLISTSLEFNSLLCGYKGADKRRAGAIRHVFSHHAYSFPHTALENNPVFSGNTSGTLGLLFQDRIIAASEWSEAPIERRYTAKGWSKATTLGEKDSGQRVMAWNELRLGPQQFLVDQQDSSRLPLPDESVDHVVTDPPYFDSVQYSDLAQFFRAWLSWMLPQAARWNYTVTDSAVAETGKDGLKYQQVLTAIWRECHRVLKKPDGRLIFTFHHWRPEAWAYLTLSLRAAGFKLVTSYTLHAENPISVHIRQLNALKHDSVLVLAPNSAASQHRAFTLPEPISTSDSHTFCQQCANVLGYCLDSGLDDASIFQLWHTMLEA
jgi:putative DNA methylase